MNGECFICDAVAKENHHIIPRRYGGSDVDENLVALCSRCHNRLEQIYDDDVFTRLNVPKGRFPSVHADEVADTDGEPNRCDNCNRSGPFRKVSLQPSGKVGFECCRCDAIHA